MGADRSSQAYLKTEFCSFGTSGAAINPSPGKPVESPRTMPDFLVGAHALLQCNGLITRDEGFFRDYFKGLKVIVPKT